MEPNDNVGVAGYNIYLDGVLLESTSDNHLELNDLVPDEDYRLSISAYDDAGNESGKSSEFIIRLPIDELEIAIYPNPSNGIFTLKLSNGVIKGNAMIQVITLGGQIIYQQPLPEDLPMPYSEQINLTDIAGEGSYIISLIEDNIRTQSFRLIIVKNILYQTNDNGFSIKPLNHQTIRIPITLISEQEEKK